MDVDGDRGDVEMTDETSSDDDEAKENEFNQKKTDLMERLRKDKTDYYAYVDLIQVLSQLAQLDDLRKIREDFSQEYPLTPEMWLAWIEDEKKIATTAEEKEHMKTLFERALQDYLSIDVWLEYVQFSIGLTAEGNHLESVRSTLERALSICGYHAAKGSLLWQLYREFEKIVLASIAESIENDEEAETRISEQKRRIGETFRRQLSVPLLEMEDTYQELQSWLKENENHETLIDMVSLEASYKKALDKLSRILPFEESLLCYEPEANFLFYQTYLNFEKNPNEGGNDPFRVRCLYERAVNDNPLNVGLWRDYIKYLSDVVKIPEDTLSTCRRAIRNCPTEGEFWCYCMVLMEKSNKPKEEMTNLLNKALLALLYNKSASRSVWLSYIFYLRRQLIAEENSDKWVKDVAEIRTIVDMAFQHQNKYFKADGDPECKLLLWWARFEAEIARDLERFRKIWTTIMDSGFSQSSTYWLKYINMEWQYGDAKHMRKLCPRALASVTDSPKDIVSLWVEYESQKGSLDSFLNCQKICDEKLKQYAENKKKDRSADKHQKLPSKLEKKDLKKEHPAKSNHHEIEDINRGSSTEKISEVVRPSVSSATVVHDPSKDDRTVFVSNLDYTVVEDDVTNIFAPVGKIEEFRLVRDFKGRCKGYGYLVFSSRVEAREALKFDRTPIKQRPMFVSECDANKYSRRSGLRFKTGMEKNKLFVKGLPLTMDKLALEKLFSPYGALRDIRIVTYRNGHSKGLAYIEFEDETSAAHALLKTDGMEIEDKTISVAISDPPERKNEASLLSGNSIVGISLGGGSGGDKKEFGIRGRGRTQLSFVPRALSTAKNSVSNASEKMDTTDSASGSSQKPKSNADFRNMLLNQK